MKFGILEVQGNVDLMPSSHFPDNASLYRAIITEADEIHVQLDYHEVVVPPYSILYVSIETALALSKEHEGRFYFLYFTEVFYRRTSFDDDLLNSPETFNTPQGFNVVTIEEELREYYASQVHFLYDVFSHKNLVVFNDLIHGLIKQLLLLGSLMGKQEEKLAHHVDADHEVVRSFRGLVEENLAVEKSVSFYAERLAISPRRLSFACKTVLNTTPKQFISKCIVKEAKRRLLYTSDSVREIAWKLGYEEENNFSAFFMKETKLSPSTYRKAYHGRG